MIALAKLCQKRESFSAARSSTWNLHHRAIPMKIIRYTTRPEHGEENERLIRAVFSELTRDDPIDVRYAVLRSGLDFVHIVDAAPRATPLRRFASFKSFQTDAATRVVAPPESVEALLLGNHRMFDMVR